MHPALRRIPFCRGLCDGIDRGETSPERPREGNILHQRLIRVSAHRLIKRLRDQQTLIAIRQPHMAAQIGPASHNSPGHATIGKGQPEPAGVVRFEMSYRRTDPSGLQNSVRMQHQQP